VSDLQSRTERGKVFQIFGRAEKLKAREPKFRLWHGTNSNKVAEARVDLVVLRSCKSSARDGGEPVCSLFLGVKVAILKHIQHIILTCTRIEYNNLFSLTNGYD